MKSFYVVCLLILVSAGFVHSASAAEDTIIAGTVYADMTGAWLPVNDAVVTVAGMSEYTQSDGFYAFLVDEAQLYTVHACVEWEGELYEATLFDVMPEEDIDLYLEWAGAADCTLPDPENLADLTISPPQISPIDDLTWQITVIISNTSSVDITEPFYVDAWTAFAPAYGYEDVSGLAAESSMELTIEIESDYPLGSMEEVEVFVDAIDEIPELDEDNNFATTAFTPTTIIDSVAIYLLAFDNPSYSAGNLAPQLPATLKGIVAATTGEPDKLAVVLADLDQDGDTHIMMVFDGEVTHVHGLPTAEGVLDTDLREYDMSDGETLGGFLLWTNRQFPANQSNLFVYAHGAPLAPETDITALFGTTQSRTPIPLPSWILAHPDMTDMHPIGLLTPYDLQVALEKGTSEGFNYHVVDLVHCFSLSIEEVYEIAPYAEMVTGSPNYAYFDAALPGAALAAIDPSMDAEMTADTILSTYNNLLPDEGYPRIMAAVDTWEVEAVKGIWDEVSAELLNAFDTDPTDTRTKLANAYQNSAKYDTNYCEPDWTLSAPDALSDMHDFARQLVFEFGLESDVGFWADLTVDQLEETVKSRYVTDGVPHFTDIDTAPFWEFTGLGVALYTDLGGVDRNGVRELSWHADFYNDVVSAENPHPYQFINSETSWADVFARYWENETITTRGCVRTFPPVRDEGELSISALISPQPNAVVVNAPVLPSISLNAVGEFGNVVVHFEIMQNGSLAYTDTIGTGRRTTGEHWLKASKAWTPTQTGNYSLTVTVDRDNFVVEQNEGDNVLVSSGVISADSPTAIQPDAAITNGQQWVTDRTAPLTLNGNGRNATQLAVNSYQFTSSGTPIPKASTTHSADNTFSLPLTGDISTGTVQLHVWEVVNGTRTQLPTALRINYIPANAPISADEMHCFPFTAAVGDQIQIRLNVPADGDANLFVWYPHSFAAPDLVGTRVGDDDMRINATPIAGDYLLCVRGVTATTYTLSVVENGTAVFTHPTTPENSPTATVPTSRPLYTQPVPQERNIPTAVSLSSSEANATEAWPPMILILVVCSLCAIQTRQNRG